MGEVYRAQDSRLRRTVAIKVLPQNQFTDPDRRRRFLQEARAASALNHPGIVTIHDIANDGGVDFLVMEYVAGHALNRLIPSDGMAVPEILDYATQMAGALAAAHAAGIVHRDIKPANVMVTPDSRVKILDFGLAKLAEPGGLGPQAVVQSGTLTMDSLTAPGSVMGTVGYMSPEQVRGQDVDHRSDIFSLGCVLYEMVVGKAPFSLGTGTDTLASILRDSPVPPSQTGKPVHPELERLILRCLEKPPEQRFQSASEIEAALKSCGTVSVEVPAPRASPPAAVPLSRRTLVAGSLAGAALIAGGVAGGFYWRAGKPRPFESLAVLPLTNATGDPENNYVAEGISESVINRLSRTKLKVTARTTAFRIKEKDLDAVTIGQQLKVAAVMSGRVTKQGNNLVVQTELVNAADGTQIWGEKFVRSLADVQPLGEEIARSIADTLQLRLTQGESREFGRRGTSNTEAYNLYLKGQYYWNKKTEDGFAKAAEYFSGAIEKDSGYAQAHAGLAHAYGNLADYRAPRDVMPKAKAAAERALALDETNADAHTALGMYHMFFSWDWKASEREFDRALALDPKNPDTLHFYSHYLEITGRPDEAVSVMRRALDLDPLSLTISSEYGYSLYLARRFEDTIQAMRKTLEMDRGFMYAAWGLAQALERAGRPEEAIAELEKLKTPGGGFILMELACAYAVAGKSKEARRILEEVKQPRKGQYLDSSYVGQIYADLDDREEAFRWLEKAYEERALSLSFIKVEPKLDRLRSETRFKNILRRMKLG